MKQNRKQPNIRLTLCVLDTKSSDTRPIAFEILEVFETQDVLERHLTEEELNSNLYMKEFAFEWLTESGRISPSVRFTSLHITMDVERKEFLVSRKVSGVWVPIYLFKYEEIGE